MVGSNHPNIFALIGRFSVFAYPSYIYYFSTVDLGKIQDFEFGEATRYRLASVRQIARPKERNEINNDRWIDHCTSLFEQRRLTIAEFLECVHNRFFYLDENRVDVSLLVLLYWRH